MAIAISFHQQWLGYPFPYILTNICYLIFLDISYSNWMRLNLTVTVICIFLMASDPGHCSMCLSAIYILSVEKFLFVFLAHFLIALLVSLLLIFLNLHILRINPLSDAKFMHIFYFVNWFLLLLSLGTPLLCRGFSAGCNPICSFLPIMSVLLGSYPRSFCLHQYLSVIPICFLL